MGLWNGEGKCKENEHFLNYCLLNFITRMTALSKTYNRLVELTKKWKPIKETFS